MRTTTTTTITKLNPSIKTNTQYDEDVEGEDLHKTNRLTHNVEDVEDVEDDDDTHTQTYTYTKQTTQMEFNNRKTDSYPLSSTGLGAS